MQKPAFTASERCLIHLLLTSFTARATQRSRHEAPFSISQEGIALALGVGRNNVPRVVARLMDRGFLEAPRERIRGFRAKRTAYYLTYQGLLEAKRIKALVEAHTVGVVLADRRVISARVQDIPSLLGVKVPLLDLINHLGEGTFDCGKYLEAKGRTLNQGGTTHLPRLRHFYGRAEMLKRLSEHLAGPELACVVVHGLAGMGKTSLVAAHYASTEVPVLYLRVRTWTTLRGVLHSIAAFGLGQGAADTFLQVEQHPTQDTEAILLAIGRDLSRVKAHLVLDDFHNAGEDITSFARGLMELPQDSHDFKLIIISREAPRIYSRARARLGDGVREIEVTGLGRDECFSLMEALGLPRKEFDKIHRLTKGHPLLIELMAVGGVPRTADTIPFIQDEVLATLGLDELRVLRRASVFRRPVTPRALVDPHDRPLMSKLAAKSLLKDTGEGTIELHDLVRDAILGGMGQAELQECNVRAASFYSNSEDLPSRIEFIHHTIEGGDQEAAARDLVRWQDDLFRGGYIRELHQILRSLRPEALPPTVAEQMEWLDGSVALVQGEWSKAQESLGRAETLSRALGDSLTLVRCLRARGDLAIWKGEYGAAVECLEGARGLAEEAGDMAGLSAIHYLLGSAYEKMGDMASARHHLTEGLDIAEEISNDLEAGRAWYAFSRLDSREGKHDKAIREQKQALEYLQRSGDLLEMAKVHTHLGGDLCHMGRIAEGREHQREAIGLAERTGDLRTLAYALYNLGWAEREAGNFQEAGASLEKALAISNALGESWSQPRIYLGLAKVNMALGEWPRAALFLNQAVVRSSKDLGTLDHVNCLLTAGSLYGKMGMPKEAAACFEEALHRSREAHLEDLALKAQELMKSGGQLRGEYAGGNPMTRPKTSAGS